MVRRRATQAPQPPTTPRDTRQGRSGRMDLLTPGEQMSVPSERMTGTPLSRSTGSATSNTTGTHGSVGTTNGATASLRYIKRRFSEAKRMTATHTAHKAEAEAALRFADATCSAAALYFPRTKRKRSAKYALSLHKKRSAARKRKSALFV
ncbi:hypothetical protein PSTT_11470 [Puccinia striiformis]|uniref:Uncharacterized protein n=1 Tax=Puccinia striiformis TaxID=27350 RepID=A0A2S4V0B2_9BASI|nr:hypothetical protein PSTT_11470 [Puccinia striiformis]